MVVQRVLSSTCVQSRAQPTSVRRYRDGVPTGWRLCSRHTRHSDDIASSRRFCCSCWDRCRLVVATPGVLRVVRSLTFEREREREHKRYTTWDNQIMRLFKHNPNYKRYLYGDCWNIIRKHLSKNTSSLDEIESFSYILLALLLVCSNKLPTKC